VETEAGTAATTIRGGHTAVVQREVNGETVYLAGEQTGGENRSGELVSALKDLTVAEIRCLAESMAEGEIAFLAEGAAMNQALADYGLHQEGGIGIARTLRCSDLLGQGFLSRVMLRVAAATEARLEGCPLATMSSAGSGSKGIALMIPVAEMAADAGACREKVLQTLAFACLMNEYINAHVGKLSAICACAMASATAVSAAMVFLRDGSDEQIAFAIRNMCGSITGMVCDGGKVGCALKLSAAMSAAVFSAALALGEVGLRPSDGICADSAEACIRNMGRVSNPGMQETDREILRIMLDKTQKD
jgi:L-cysteine desulfidase